MNDEDMITVLGKAKMQFVGMIFMRSDSVQLKFFGCDFFLSLAVLFWPFSLSINRF